MDARAFWNNVTPPERLWRRKTAAFDVDHTMCHAMHEVMIALEFVLTGEKEAGYSYR
jgi:hypothetical protein